MEKINFSAKDLLCRSCMQIKMFLEKPELKPKPNVNQWQGVDYQHEIALTIKDIIGEEMGGCFEYDEVKIYISNDIVTKDKIIEVKYLDEDRVVEEWYLNSCLLQCAVYKALTVECENKLRTSLFHINNGNSAQNCIIDNDFEYLLYFGKDKYKIDVHNSKKIIEFIRTKAKHCLTWENARFFDNQYKRKEYDILKDCFTFNKI